MSVAVVILNWNGEAMLRRFLPVLLQHVVRDVSVFVADNASTDGSLSMLSNEFPQVKIIVLDHNYGFAGGYNRALRQVEADYYLLLNSDVEVTPGWLQPMLRFMESHPRCAACQPKLLSFHKRDSFEYAGGAGGFIDKYGYPFCRGRIFSDVEKDEGQYDDCSQVFWTTGACMLIRSNDYWRAGGLDERFFAHNEEIDLCWRLRLMGRELYCVPGSVVYHVGGGTLPKGNPRKTYLNFRNNLTMLHKNLPDAEYRQVMIVRFFLDHLAALQALLLGRSWADCKAILKARYDFHRWKKDFCADRKQIRQMTIVESIPERFSISLLWAYYIKGIRKFSSLC